MDRFDKQQITTASTVLIVAILAALYYFGYIKLPAVVQPLKEKTRQELLNDFNAELTAGKLNNVSGTISKISGKIITLTISANGDQKEQNIAITDNTLIRRLTMPELKPGDGLTPMIETFITPADLRVGNNILVNLKDSVVIELDVIPALSIQTSVAPNEAERIATTTERITTTTTRLLTERLVNLGHEALSLIMAGREAGDIQIFGTITGIENNILTVRASPVADHLMVIPSTSILDLKEDPITKKPTKNFISLTDLHISDFVLINADKDAKIALFIVRQKAIEKNN